MTTHCCRCCGQALPSRRESIDRLVAQLRTRCTELSIQPNWEGFVDEAAAAALLNRSAFTLRNQRLELARIPEFRRVGRRIEYSLPAIAGFLLDTESNWPAGGASMSIDPINSDGDGPDDAQ